MDRSLNEIEAMSRRAARGAGFDWGMAEDAGKAARWLASHGLPGPALLADLLMLNDGIPPADLAPVSLEDTWRAPSGRLCPLLAGAALSDQSAKGKVKMCDVSFPLLLLPFAAAAADHLRRPMALTWQGVRVGTDGARVQTSGASDLVTTAHAKNVVYAPAEALNDATTPSVRGEVSADAWALLSKLAHRTYAPATEASRLLGAGAGLSDND